MPKKKQVYHYPENGKEMAFNIIDKSLGEYLSNEYRDNLKSIVNEQMIAMKHPSFIAQTVFEFIDYEIKYCYIDTDIPNPILIALKNDLINALEGNE